MRKGDVRRSDNWYEESAIPVAADRQNEYTNRPSGSVTIPHHEPKMKHVLLDENELPSYFEYKSFVVTMRPTGRDFIAESRISAVDASST